RGAYHPAAGAIQTADFTWFDARGEALGRIEGFTLHRAPKDRFFGAPARHDALYGVQWLPVEASGGSVDPALAVWVGPRSAWTGAAGIDRFDEIPALIARLSEREGPPRYVLLDARSPRQGSTGALAI